MTVFTRVMRIRRGVIFRKEKGLYGCCWTGKGEPHSIIINLSLHERRLPSRTYLHECLHILYPKVSERDIRAMEEMVWNTLTTRQRFLLARKLYYRKWKGK